MGNAMCDVPKKECVPRGEEAACRDGEFCDPLRRCVQCLNNDQCGPGLYCNAALGRCESNVQCVDDANDCPNVEGVECVVCVSPQICDRRTRRCQAPPTTCEDDTGCAGDQLCDLDQDPPICVPRIPDCLADLLEPNNSSGAARQLDPLVSEHEELKLCPGDADWYRIDVEAGTYLTIDFRFRQIDGDIDVQLFLADGRTLVDESRSITDNERVELEVGTDLTLLVRTFLAVPSVAEVPYRMIITRDDAPLCADDAHEPDDQIGGARIIQTDQPYEGRVCPADPDWFVITGVPAGTRITADLEFNVSLGDLELELYRASSSAPLLRASTITDNERLVYDASFAGDYYFRVFGKQADGNVYTLRVVTRPNPGAVCTDDLFEVNNAPPEATRAPDMTGTEAQGLTMCGGDEDWYVMSLNIGEAISAEIGFDAQADLELKLYAPGAVGGNSAPIRQGVGNTPREYLGRRVFVPGDYYVRVHGLTPGDIAPYELRLERLPPAACLPDRIDQMGAGNDRLSAFDMPFPPGRLDKLSFCSGDSDWYRAFLLAGNTNIIRLQFVEDDANLELAIYDQTGAQLLATNATGSDFKEIVANVPGPQGAIAVVFLQVVFNGGFESSSYSLTLDLVPSYNCLPDISEPNENAAIASLITSSTRARTLIEDLTLCTSNQNPLNGAGDEDWFVLRPPRAGARINVDLSHAQGDLFLELFSPGAVRRACFNSGADRCYSDGFDLNEMITFTATTTQPYLLRVGSIYSSPNVPIRPLNTDTEYQLEINYQ